MTFWVYLVLFLYGITFGSFLNVCILRIPRQHSLLTSSICPRCERRIRFYDNIPLVSFLFLEGRCRHCSDPISIRYFLVEAATGLLFMATYWKFGFGWAWILNTVFLCMIIVLMLIDYDHKILPNVITLSGAVLGLLASPLQDLDFFRDVLTSLIASTLTCQSTRNIVIAYAGSMMGIALGGGLLWLVAELYYRLKKVEGLGFGDVKMMAMIGAFLGWKFALLTIFFGSISGSVVGLILIKFQNRDAHFLMPFGTFLGIGTFISVFVGQEILRWYLRFY